MSQARPQKPRPERETPMSQSHRQGLLRAEHAGRWVAWTMDESQIVAAGGDPLEVQADAQRKGDPKVILDWVPPLQESRSADRATGWGLRSRVPPSRVWGVPMSHLSIDRWFSCRPSAPPARAFSTGSRTRGPTRP